LNLVCSTKLLGVPRPAERLCGGESVGANLPAEVVVNPLPLTIVPLVPEFTGYDNFVMAMRS
jgi:hypothetical protein